MKRMLILLLALFGVHTVHAQWSVSPELGMTSVKASGTDGWSARFTAGVGVEYELTKHFSLKSGLYYVNRGYKTSYMYSYGYPESETVLFFEEKPRYSYLQMPIMPKWRWNVAEDVRFTLAVGPYIGYRIQVGGDVDIYSNMYGFGIGGGYGYNRTTVSISGADGEYKFNWGSSLAVGIEVKNWMMNLGWDMDLGKRYKGENIQAQYHTISLSLGYKFRL